MEEEEKKGEGGQGFSIGAILEVSDNAHKGGGEVRSSARDRKCLLHHGPSCVVSMWQGLASAALILVCSLI